MSETPTDGRAPALDALATRLAGCEGLLVLTGAGVSVASGLPTYRSEADSLYRDPEALRYAFGSTLRRDPAGFWARFAPRRAALAAARPNAGHLALAALEGRFPRFLLATQNVDDLHRRAGSAGVVELHGNALRERCLELACPAGVWPAPAPAEPGAWPRCPRCGGPARPDVVLFGEGDADRWEPVVRFVAAGVEAILLVGTAGVVPVPEDLLRLAAGGAARPFVACVDPRLPDGPELRAAIDVHVAGPAEQVLPALLARLR